ncbi:MAG: putative spermidine/putrescine transport system ATP-binding protein, partial [Actinomycetota bacterium]|nr:putative spermidine/putrescine transport system ATP-binding protein [Actinomycetota bacterium]
YARPATAFVAEFVGTMNHLAGVVTGSGAEVDVAGQRLKLAEPGERPDGAAVRVLVRPESVTLEAGGPARITDHSFHAAAELLPGTAADVGFGSRPVLLAADA